MDDALHSLGFNAKEILVYKIVVKEGSLTAAQIAKLSKEKRTNVYMILEGLLERGVVEQQGASGARSYQAADPSSLTKLLVREKQRYAQAEASLAAIMPTLKSSHTLSRHKPGVVHIAGLDGYKLMLADMTRSTTDIALIARTEAIKDPEVYAVLISNLHKRKTRGVCTRTLFYNAPEKAAIRTDFEARGMDLRFLGDKPYPGEVAVYEDKTIFTVYDPSLVTTIISNASIAQTMRLMFDQLWENAA